MSWRGNVGGGGHVGPGMSKSHPFILFLGDVNAVVRALDAVGDPPDASDVNDVQRALVVRTLRTIADRASKIADEIERPPEDGEELDAEALMDDFFSTT